MRDLDALLLWYCRLKLVGWVILGQQRRWLTLTANMF